MDGLPGGARGIVCFRCAYASLSRPIAMPSPPGPSVGQRYPVLGPSRDGNKLFLSLERIAARVRSVPVVLEEAKIRNFQFDERCTLPTTVRAPGRRAHAPQPLPF